MCRWHGEVGGASVLSECMTGRSWWVQQAGSSNVETEMVKGSGFAPEEGVFRCLACGLSLCLPRVTMDILYHPWLALQQPGVSRHLEDAGLCFLLLGAAVHCAGIPRVDVGPTSLAPNHPASWWPPP